jgi:hypothetical protein
MGLQGLLQRYLCLYVYILWRLYPLLSNGSAYTFQRTHNNGCYVLCGQCYSSLLGNTTILTTEEMFSIRSVPRLYNESLFVARYIPCGGWVEFLHRSSASRRRRRKGKSRIWDSKIWSRVPRDSDPKMTALASTSSNCIRQTRSLVRESAKYQQTHSCVTDKNLVVSPRWVLDTKTYWPTGGRS